MTLDLTAFDAFCGAGGSSTGLRDAGFRVVAAANHWPLAIDTHSTNHPNTSHFIEDLQRAHPSLFPLTTLAWFSPSCTNHSLAKGKKRTGLGQLDLWGETGIDPAEERSRATMREVVEFTEYHRYEFVIVENVVDVRKWQFYDEWLTAMLNLGYHHKILYLNAQFFGVPQSRDRFYAVFWKAGNRAPNLDFRPSANCPKHGDVGAVLVWKKPEFPWGRYGLRRQYTYHCPHCGAEVMPQFRPAADVIDWTIPSQKIGDRKKPLEEKTMNRILAGLRKFGHWPHISDMGHSHAEHNGKVHSIESPLPTETSQLRHALVEPFITSYYSREAAKGWPVSEMKEPLPTVTGDPRHAVVSPPFLVEMYGKSVVRSVDNPLATITAKGNAHHGVLTPPFITSYYGQGGSSGVNEPLPTIVTVDRHALVTPESLLPECRFRMLEPEELKRGMGFPSSYVILGNKRDQVRQSGNAVCCPVAQAIAERLIASLQ